jgi:predicted nucleotidyltransferase
MKSDKTIEIIVTILKKNGIRKASIFGSYARGEAKKKSDIDLIIEPKKGMGLFNFVGVKQELEHKLRRKVDLITYNSINKHLKPYIQKEQVSIL